MSIIFFTFGWIFNLIFCQVLPLTKENVVPEYVEEEALLFGPSECCLHKSYIVSLPFSFSPIPSLKLLALQS